MDQVRLTVRSWVLRLATHGHGHIATTTYIHILVFPLSITQFPIPRSQLPFADFLFVDFSRIKSTNMFYNLMQYYTRSAGNRRGTTFLLLWLAWLLGGTFWYGYANHSDLGFIKGFYMAVNIGYSIGFGYPAEPHTPYHW